MDRRAFLRAAGPAAVIGIAGCSNTSETTTDADMEYDVGMSAAAFRPETLRVEPGTTVRWKNTSKQGHSVTAYEDGVPDGAQYFASGGFDSEEQAREAWGSSAGGTLFEGQTFEHTFEVRGEYSYFCIPHERAGMVGTVVVTDDA
jgi:plastocyanin